MVQLFSLGFAIKLSDHVSATAKHVMSSVNAMKHSIATPPSTYGWAGVAAGINQQRAIAAQNAAMISAGKGMMTAGAGIFASSAAMGYAFKRGFIDPALDAERALKDLQATLHLDAAALNAVRAASLTASDAGLGTTATFREQVGMFARLTHEQHGMAQALDATRTAMMLSEVSGVDAATVTKMLAREYMIFGSSQKSVSAQIREFGNALQASRRFFPDAELSKMHQGIVRLGPMAKSLRMDPADTIALSGALNLFSARYPAALQFASLFTKILADGKAMQALHLKIVPGPGSFINVLEQIQHRLATAGPADVSKFGKAFSSALPVILGLIKILPELKTATRGVRNSANELDTAYSNYVRHNYDKQIRIFEESFKNLGIEVGTDVLPSFTRFTDRLTIGIHWVREWAHANPELTTTLVKVAGALTGLGAALGLGVFTAGGVFWSIGNIAKVTGMSFGGAALGILEFAAALTLSAAALYLWYSRWEKIKDGLKNFTSWENLKAIVLGLANTIAPPVQVYRGGFATQSPLEGAPNTPPWAPHLPPNAPWWTPPTFAPPAPPVAARAPKIHLTYSPTVNMTGGTDEATMQGLLDQHSDDLLNKILDALNRAREVNY